MDELAFYVPSTVFQSLRDDAMKERDWWPRVSLTNTPFLSGSFADGGEILCPFDACLRQS